MPKVGVLVNCVRKLVGVFAVVLPAVVRAAVSIGSEQAFLDEVVSHPDGEYVLTSDISLSSPFAAIPEFSGSLDGNGKTITGLSSNLVGVLTGTLKNLTVSGVTYQHKRVSYSNCSPFGFFATTVSGGSISNCTLRGCTLTRDKYANYNAGVGGIVGNIGATGGVVAGCKVIGCSIGTILGSETMTIGGVVGRSFAAEEGSALVADCCVVSEEGAPTVIKGNLVGGIVGGVSVDCFLRVERCRFDASIEGGSNVGCILGPCSGGNTDKSIIDVVGCTNLADVSVACPASGIVAGSYKGGLFRISGCINRGNITTSTASVTTANANGTGTAGIMGGLYAQASGAGIVVDRSANYGTITAENDFAGGLVGFLHMGNYAPVLTISNSVNHADVTSSHYVGGLAGYALFPAGGALFVNCCQTGAVTGNGTVPAGGISGLVRGGNKLSYRCVNVCQMGDVTASDGAASSLFGELSVNGKNNLKVYIDNVQVQGTASSTSGTTGIIGGSTTVADPSLSVFVDETSRFSCPTGVAYYDQTGAAQELALGQLPAGAMTNRTAARTLDDYASANGLVGWVQAPDYPELSIFAETRPSGLLVIIR